MDNLTDRRTILEAVGVGVTVGLAGCSGNGNDTEPSAQGTSTDSTETNQTTDTSDTNSETGNGDVSGDVVHAGEEEFERYISSVGDSEDLDDVSSYTDLGDSEYVWMEFEDVESQVDFDFGEFNDGPASVEEAENLDRMETMYLALREASDGYGTIWAGLIGGWDEDSSVPKNYLNGNFFEGGEVTVSSDSTESFFGENVEDYSDVSDDFPQEYLDLVEE